MSGTVLPWSYRLGAHHACRWWLRRRLTVLTYHGFQADDDPAVRPGCPSARVFEAHLKYVRRYYQPLSLAEAWSRLKADRLPDNAVVLTSDDGYESVASVAWPLLKKYNVPMTVFVTTGFVDREEPLWFDRISFAAAGDVQRQREWNARGKSCPQEEREAFVRTVEKEAGRALTFGPDMRPYSRPLTWDQARLLAASGLVSFGAHGRGHYILSRCGEALRDGEIRHSVDRVTKELDGPPLAYAYPNGEAKDKDDRLVPLFKKYGISLALTTVHGFNTKDTDPYAWRRITAGGKQTTVDLALQMVLWDKIRAKLM